MSKRVYISADYDLNNGDRDVVDELNKWGNDSLHKVDFIDMSEVKSGSVALTADCRICDLKSEFNHQINASSAVIFVIGDMTKYRTAGSECERTSKEQKYCFCTPYKQNANGAKACKVSKTSTPTEDQDVGNINTYSYLRHEFEQAKKKKRTIIIVYNSTRKENNWLPDYMNGYENIARPFWTTNANGKRVGDYTFIKEVLVF